MNLEEKEFKDHMKEFYRMHEAIFEEPYPYITSDEYNGWIRPIKEKYGELEDKKILLAFNDESTVAEVHDDQARNEKEPQICAKVIDTNLEPRNDIEVMVGYYTKDDINVISYAHGPYIEFRKALLKSDIKFKYDILMHLNNALAISSLVPFGVYYRGYITDRSIEFDKVITED